MADPTILQYGFLPNAVQANTRANFTLTVTNASGSDLNLTRDDEIYLILPVGSSATDLTPDLNDVSPSAPPGWRFDKFQGETNRLIISPLANLTFANGASLQFVMANVIINPSQGGCTLALQEYIGVNEGQTSFAVNKSEAQFSIIAQAIPSSVGKNQSTRLKWTAVKAGYVTIDPLGIRVDTVGEITTIPYQDLTPPQAQVTYTFTAWTQDQKFVKDLVVVTIVPPVIRAFEPQHQAPIDYDDSVTLSWIVDYAEQVMLVLPQGPVKVDARGSLQVQPKTMLSTNASVATYTLRATGTGNPVLAYVKIPFKPVVIDYFRYRSFTDTTVDSHVTNGRGTITSHQGAQGQYWQMVATGPYGPLTQYLGHYNAVQVQVFVVSAQGAAAGTELKLEWQTYLATSLSLQVNGHTQAIASDQIARGSMAITPQASSTYVLLATDAQGNSVSSSLLVTVA